VGTTLEILKYLASSLRYLSCAQGKILQSQVVFVCFINSLTRKSSGEVLDKGGPGEVYSEAKVSIRFFLRNVYFKLCCVDATQKKMSVCVCVCVCVCTLGLSQIITKPAL
jgi:hypothetical protein